MKPKGYANFMANPCEILTPDQMRRVEDAAIAGDATTATALMEAAGQAAAERIATHWPDAENALILCGSGNNGGDGYVIARHLAARGWQVRVVALALPSGPQAQAAARAWGGPVVPLGGPVLAAGQGVDICIDAICGIGLNRPLAADLAGLLRAIAAAGVPLVAVDILSGLCAASGRALGDVELPAADLTVSFHRPKLGHVLAQGGQLSGRLEICDIRLEPYQPAAGACVTLAHADAGVLKRQGHKYSHGHLLVLAGGPGRGGAARLAARGALRVGAGLVTVGCPADALAENAARLDAIMLRALPDAAALTQMLRDRRLNAICLGPGLGHDLARAMLPAALAAGRATVLDADALGAFSETPDTLFAALHDRCVLTPHDGEFARLFPDLARRMDRDRPGFSRLEAARAAAQRAGAVVLLKGPDTVIAAPDGQARIAAATGENAAPWLATAGSGDVLAGIIAGLLARGQPPLAAAASGAWLHAEAARRFGPGLIAEDLPDQLPAVFRGIG